MVQRTTHDQRMQRSQHAAETWAEASEEKEFRNIFGDHGDIPGTIKGRFGWDFEEESAQEEDAQGDAQRPHTEKPRREDQYQQTKEWDTDDSSSDDLAHSHLTFQDDGEKMMNLNRENEEDSPEEVPYSCTSSYATCSEDSYQIATGTELEIGTIMIFATINGKNARVMIDSGATSSHINESFVRRHEIPALQTEEWVTITGFNGEVMREGYKRKTLKLTMRSGRYTTKIAFDVTPLDERAYDAILGMTWLKDQNPVIDWTAQTVAVGTVMLESTKGTKNPEAITTACEESRTNPTQHQEIRNEPGKEQAIRQKPKELYEEELRQVKEKTARKIL
ncbi:hypothetical protein V1525DRAFT_132725 [Lipomyces kononenkoae]|uniref:Uncharacterized protein n=1 Tax=Lipomyces kononenkoae TaxID=34357 RepID=A0ACC3SRM2_LIPKO